jgi:acyl-CoA synthetase
MPPTALADLEMQNHSLAAILSAHAIRNPDGLALIEPERCFSWRQYDQLSDAIAAQLRAAGLTPGEHVGLLLPDGIILHAAMMGAEKAGLVAIGLGARTGMREAAHLLAKGDAQALVSLAAHRGDEMKAAFLWLAERVPDLRAHIILPNAPEALLANAPEALLEAVTAEKLPLTIEPGDLFLLNSTSGTTGMPKCVMHDQLRWFAFHKVACAAGELSESDVMMSCAPSPFGFGLWTSHATPLLLGIPVIVFPQFDADIAIAMLERYRVTVMAAVTTQMIMMLNLPRFATADLSSLRVIFSGGEAIPPERARAFETRTGAKVLNFYGSNETGGLSCTTVDDPQEQRLTTAGRLIANMDVRLFDEAGRDVTAGGRGRPAGKGPLLSRGYYGDDTANARLFTPDGWMLMDDFVEIDDAGYLHVLGRTGDFVLRGGKNVSCAAVEEMASTHPAVHLAAALAAPDPKFGERVALFVTLRAGWNELSLEDIVAHFRAHRTSPEIWPELLQVLPDMPRSAGDKIAKHQLRQEVAALVAATAKARESSTAS